MRTTLTNIGLAMGLVAISMAAGWWIAPKPATPPPITIDAGWQDKALEWESKVTVMQDKLTLCEARAARLAGQVAFVERWIMAARRMRDAHEAEETP